MNEELRVITTQMVVFAVLLSIGGIAAKGKVLTSTALDALAKIVIFITLPAMIITLVPAAGSREILIQMLPFLICSFLLIIFLFYIGKITAKMGKLREETKDIHIAETTFGSVGFMGIPLLLALYGEKGILYTSVFSVADHTMLWTLGTYLTAKDKDTNIKKNLKKIINPTTIALGAALLLIVLGIQPKGVVTDTVKGLGDTTKFLSMVYIGGTLASIDFKNIWKKKTIYLIVIMKMVIAPIGVFFLFGLMEGFFSKEAIMTLTLVAALPSMVTIAMLARANGSDDVYAAECVFVTTILSIFTIPLVMIILNSFS